ncbi:capsular biosynthesis protein [Vibrio ostreicida]|uniref:capsular biosynthesis protein n=1 Tax=Vibrio ostreicida TaxID=526588 RepID=UPI003B5C6A5D
MFLIMSGAYIGQELESEFGQLPPSFLPLGNKRLFQHQVSLAPKSTDTYLSVPESFTISPIDKTWLDSQNVTVLSTPDGLSLGASLVAALNLSGHGLDKPLHILYGDTLYRELPVGDDLASISYTKDSYHWAVLTNDSAHWLNDGNHSISGEAQRIIDGYFKFSNPRELIKCITQCEWNFIQGLNKYHQSVGLTAIDSSGWLDFGHVNTYYRSKADFTTQRSFNELTITPKWIEKSSTKSEKIAAEANWFASLPAALRGNIPQFMGTNDHNGKISYRLEYLHLTALNELFVFAKLPSQTWRQILISCIDFLKQCREHKAPSKAPSNTLSQLFSLKTKQRLVEYCGQHQITLEQKWSLNGSDMVSISEILSDSATHLPNQHSLDTVLHGDFCFSNILYDFRASKVKTIDPRGITPEGEKTLYGDLRYDIAKLSHSVLGLYDWIIAGYFDVDINEDAISFDIAGKNRHKETQQAFIELVEKEFGLSAKNLYAMQIQLFLSMLPLHADNPLRQNALFANAFRLHQILLRLKQ